MFSIASQSMPTVHLLPYVAGNIRSLVNAIEKLGYTVQHVQSPSDIAAADVSEEPSGAAPLMQRYSA